MTTAARPSTAGVLFKTTYAGLDDSLAQALPGLQPQVIQATDDPDDEHLPAGRYRFRAILILDLQI